MPGVQCNGRAAVQCKGADGGGGNHSAMHGDGMRGEKWGATHGVCRARGGETGAMHGERMGCNAWGALQWRSCRHRFTAPTAEGKGNPPTPRGSGGAAAAPQILREWGILRETEGPRRGGKLTGRRHYAAITLSSRGSPREDARGSSTGGRHFLH